MCPVIYREIHILILEKLVTFNNEGMLNSLCYKATVNYVYSIATES